MVDSPTPGILLDQAKKGVPINLDVPGTIALSLKSQLAVVRADDLHHISKYCGLDHAGFGSISQSNARPIQEFLADWLHSLNIQLKS